MGDLMVELPDILREGSFRLPARIVEISSERSKQTTVLLSSDSAQRVSGLEGQILVQVALPSGRTVSATTELTTGPEDQTLVMPLSAKDVFEFPAVKRSAAQPNASWNLPTSKNLFRLAAEKSSPSNAAEINAAQRMLQRMEESFKGNSSVFRLWRSKRFTDWAVIGEVTASYLPLEGGLVAALHFDRFGEPRFLEVPFDDRNFYVAVPPHQATTVLLRMNAEDEQAPFLGADVRFDNSDSRSLLHYLHNGDFESARILAENLADSAEIRFRITHGDPTSAVIAAYSLLRAGDLSWLDYWTAYLDNHFPELPDGAVICVWHLLRTEDADYEQIADRLLAALDLGVPVFTEGLRRLMDGLMIVAQEFPERQDLQNAIGLCRAYLLCATPFGDTTTFIATHPQFSLPFAKNEGIEREEPQFSIFDPEEDAETVIATWCPRQSMGSYRSLLKLRAFDLLSHAGGGFDFDFDSPGGIPATYVDGSEPLELGSLALKVADGTELLIRELTADNATDQSVAVRFDATTGGLVVDPEGFANSEWRFFEVHSARYESYRKSAPDHRTFIALCKAAAPSSIERDPAAGIVSGHLLQAWRTAVRSGSAWAPQARWWFLGNLLSRLEMMLETEVRPVLKRLPDTDVHLRDLDSLVRKRIDPGKQAIWDQFVSRTPTNGEE